MKIRRRCPALGDRITRSGPVVEHRDVAQGQAARSPCAGELLRRRRKLRPGAGPEVAESGSARRRGTTARRADRSRSLARRRAPRPG
eukprot:3408268-Alexandrium_andersonii.AAC.1